MGRNVKPGITFYRMDSGHVLNKKIRLLFNEYGGDGYYIWSCLLDYAYLHKGYYFDLNDREEVELFASEFCKLKLSLVQEVIGGCIRRGLFDKAVSDAFNILTCEMMQEVFLYATSERRDKGSVFEMQENWLLLDFSDKFPRNIKIVPGKKAEIPLKIPQTKQDKTETETKQKLLAHEAPEKENDLHHSDKKTDGKGQDARRQKFIAPQLQEVQDYFLKQFNPKNPNTWFPDKCKAEANDFFNFYTANGWKQGRQGKPIISWPHAANLWVSNSRKGTFNTTPIVAAKAVTPVRSVIEQREAVSNLNEIERSINFLYERYVETPDDITYLSVDSTFYDRLKQCAKISFSDDTVQEIKQKSIDTLKGKNIEPAEDLIRSYMKKIAVIEFFKQCSKEGKEVIYEEQGLQQVGNWYSVCPVQKPN
jgi:hypothetical protein